MEKELKADESLMQNLRFSCLEIGIPPTDILPEKMLHTHGNELVQNRCRLANIEEGKVVDAPMILRDSLKVLTMHGEPASRYACTTRAPIYWGFAF